MQVLWSWSKSLKMSSRELNRNSHYHDQQQGGGERAGRFETPSSGGKTEDPTVPGQYRHRSRGTRRPWRLHILWWIGSQNHCLPKTGERQQQEGWRGGKTRLFGWCYG